MGIGLPDITYRRQSWTKDILLQILDNGDAVSSLKEFYWPFCVRLYLYIALWSNYLILGTSLTLAPFTHYEVTVRTITKSQTYCTASLMQKLFINKMPQKL